MWKDWKQKLMAGEETSPSSTVYKVLSEIQAYRRPGRVMAENLKLFEHC